MREYKFRGMGIDGNWYYGLLAYTENKSLACGDTGWFISNRAGVPFAYQIRPETRSQFTGLKDKNGKEIYEGDIVKVSDPRKICNPFIAEICWSDEQLAWAFKEGLEWKRPLESMSAWIDGRIIEIIGNIYKNPYKLEEVQK